MKIQVKFASIFLLLVAISFSACGAPANENVNPGSGGESIDPIALDNYTKIATAYLNGISSASVSSVDSSNSAHIITTVHNADNSVKLVTSVFKDCSSILQGIQGSYIFDNYTAPNGVILNGSLNYYTPGTTSTEFVVQGTLTATGTANGVYVYKVKSDNNILTGYAGINGIIYYNYSTSTITTIEPSYSLPVIPIITYCGQPVPSAPGAAIVIAGNNQLSLSWSAVAEATAYEVWYGLSSNSGSATKYIIDVTSTSITLTGLTGGSFYYIWLKAKNAVGTSDFGAVANGTPILAIPNSPGAAIINADNTQLLLSWTAVSGATAYEVWYSTTNDSSTSTQQGGDIAATNYTLNGLLNGTLYYVWLKAKNSAGTSAFGSVASGKPSLIPSVSTYEIKNNDSFTSYIKGTSAVGGGSVISQGDSAVTERGICWNTTGNPTISNSKAVSGSGVGNFSNCTLSNLTPNTVYYVRAFATNSSGTAYGLEKNFNSGRTFGTEIAGGYVFFNNGNGGGLISAKTDQSSGKVWSNITNASVYGTSTLVGTGQANTLAIIGQSGHTTSAAKVCDAYSPLIYKDWYLPSQGELVLMKENLHLNGFGNFQPYGYWSSSELDETRAYVVIFNGLTLFWTEKSYTNYVRAIRTF